MILTLSYKPIFLLAQRIFLLATLNPYRNTPQETPDSKAIYTRIAGLLGGLEWPLYNIAAGKAVANGRLLRLATRSSATLPLTPARAPLTFPSSVAVSADCYV